MHNVFNIDQFKLYTIDPLRLTSSLQLLRSIVHHGNEWELEAILNHNGIMIKDLEYHVKWVRYEPTWEPVMDLKGTANKLLRKYYKAHRLRVYK
jgi:hypothetical protein